MAFDLSCLVGWVLAEICVEMCYCCLIALFARMGGGECDMSMGCYPAAVVVGLMFA